MTDTTTRDTQLRNTLSGRRRELQADIHQRIRDGRSDRTSDVHDDLEYTDNNNAEDIAFALLQMKVETLRRIDEALRRLDAGTYGDCFECGLEISEARLGALPFAVRCRTCEEQREQRQIRVLRPSDGHEHPTIRAPFSAIATP